MSLKKYVIKYPAKNGNKSVIVTVDQENYTKFVRCGFPVGTEIFTEFVGAEILNGKQALVKLPAIMQHIPTDVIIKGYFEWGNMYEQS